MASFHSRRCFLGFCRGLVTPALFLALSLWQQGSVGLRAQAEPPAGPNSAGPENSAGAKDSRPPSAAFGRSSVLAVGQAQHPAGRSSAPNPLETSHGVSLHSALILMRLGDFNAAVQAYRQALELEPNNIELKLGLARALSLSGRHEESKRLYQQVLSKNPADADALEGLGNALLRSDHPSEAHAIFERLVAKQPLNLEFQVDLARAEARLGHYKQAREILSSVLTPHPHEREARLQLADIKLYEGKYTAALADFSQLLKADPTDFDALLGNARAHYFRGDIAYSYKLVSKLVQDHPNNYDAVFLLANLERARHHPRQARELLARADQLSTSNAECHLLEETLHQEQAVTFHAAASYARETSAGNDSPDLIGFAGQDLRRFGYESGFDFSSLPGTRSSVIFDSTLISSSGSLGGAVAPSQVSYRQTTPIFSSLILRAGVGLIRFGPGGLQEIPGQSEPVSVATYRPLGYASVSYAPKKKIEIDLTAAREPIPYTPLSVRMGVMESRLEGGLKYSPDSHTNLLVDLYYGNYFSTHFKQLGLLQGNPSLLEGGTRRQPGRGASLGLVRNILRFERASLDLGYQGRTFAFSGSQQQDFMGFFNPSFYQVHQLTARVYGVLRGPLGYDFSGGMGVQQVDSHQPFTQALNLTPGMSFKISRHFALKLGYTYYNYAQSLGVIRGNGVILSTDTRF